MSSSLSLEFGTVESLLASWIRVMLGVLLTSFTCALAARRVLSDTVDRHSNVLFVHTSRNGLCINIGPITMMEHGM